MTKNRYALLTVDTEAQPCRAANNHVEKLMWGKHENGTAGIAQMCAIGDIYGAKHTFFVDFCAAYNELEKIKEVVLWLDAQDQDVQLHSHPEYLPQEFRKAHKLAPGHKLMNLFTAEKNLTVIRYFSNLLSSITQKPVTAFRAGSFRWNEDTLKALKECNIPLSFNNSVVAMHNEQCPFSIAQNAPFQWSNGIYEIPVTEQDFLHQRQYRTRLHYPSSKYLQLLPRWLSFLPHGLSRNNDFLVVLLHSWSFLHWDENRHAFYKDSQRMEQYHTFLKRLSKDYDIITSVELLDLIQSGKIAPTHEEETQQAAYTPGVKG